MKPTSVARTLLLLPVLATLAPARSAHADPPTMCPPTSEPGIESVLPADGAAAVTTDAWIRVRYSAGYFVEGKPLTETITVTRDDDKTSVAGRIEVVGDRDLFFVPSAPLAPNTLYDGVASSSLDFPFSFTTGEASDTRSPILQAHEEDPNLDLSSAPATTECGIEEGSRRVGLTFSSASDDGPAASIEYYLYLTRGPGVTDPVLVASARNYSSTTTTLGFVLPPAQLQSMVCVSLAAVDGVGRSSTWQDPLCFDPVDGTSFYGACDVAPTRTATAPPLVVLAACLAVVARRSRRARRRD